MVGSSVNESADLLEIRSNFMPATRSPVGRKLTDSEANLRPALGLL
jgi:hypothetical protein